MKIPLVEKLPPDIRVPKGKYEGTDRYYKTALWNTLLHLRPLICLEIGTWKGGSAKIFERYFGRYQPHGLLVTADVRKYTNVASQWVRQILVCPHDLNICQNYRVKEEDLLPNWRERVADSIEANSAILRRELEKLRIEVPLFDFAFVDGDHWHLLKDLEIVRQIVAWPHYALLDDTQTGIWECGKVYHEQVKHEWNHYDFDDWDIFTGTSLIWEKNTIPACTTPNSTPAGRRTTSTIKDTPNPL